MTADQLLAEALAAWAADIDAVPMPELPALTSKETPSCR